MSAQIDDTITYTGARDTRADTYALRPAVTQAAGWKGWQITAALLLGLAAAAALAALAAVDWLRSSERAISPGPLGGLYSVQLVNGQVYYGVLQEVKPAYIRLGDVYYIQSYQQPNGQPGNRVVSRRKNDWHGPETQTIPADKILSLDAVGLQSQLAKLIQQDKTGNP
ncbi:hypothetical protein GTP46_28170 [Duganella sp. FT135W]|uniref:Uncharacterized protein n=1 Tax=Duganella flavida TaxID=2692175 RepID=A0A6L8KIC9_9BURK|nr:hypothetical protein [Duganella flavida]MYM26507.1 hypothetical protein [Duganella flavida]